MGAEIEIAECDEFLSIGDCRHGTPSLGERQSGLLARQGRGRRTSEIVRMSYKLELSLSQVKLPSSAIIDYGTSRVSRQFGYRPLAERGPATLPGSPILPGWRGCARREAEAAGGTR